MGNWNRGLWRLETAADDPYGGVDMRKDKDIVMANGDYSRDLQGSDKWESGVRTTDTVVMIQRVGVGEEGKGGSGSCEGPVTIPGAERFSRCQRACSDCSVGEGLAGKSPTPGSRETK